jgi:hypothetical protein
MSRDGSWFRSLKAEMKMYYRLLTSSSAASAMDANILGLLLRLAMAENPIKEEAAWAICQAAIRASNRQIQAMVEETFCHTSNISCNLQVKIKSMTNTINKLQRKHDSVSKEGWTKLQRSIFLLLKVCSNFFTTFNSK